MKALDVANMFVHKYGDSLYLTNLKLNKLVYYTQAVALQEFGHPLFDDRIEAWQYGPVERSVYKAFKGYGKGQVTSRVMPPTPAHAPSNEAIALVDLVANEYGPLTASELVSFSHRDGSAWKQAYDSTQNAEITPELIMSSRDGLDKPNLQRSLHASISSVDSQFPNALRLLRDS